MHIDALISERAVGDDELVRELAFFFFQAEDGIRDYKVTGVQTCALPICELEQFLRFTYRAGTDPFSLRGSYAGAMGMGQFMPSSWVKWRSEERRVGKECRSRWSPYH